jgi:hypothetical protein
MAGSLAIDAINEHLDPANPALYAQAQAVVANAASCIDVIDGLRAPRNPPLGLEEDLIIEAVRDVLGGLPRAIDLATLAGVRSGLARSIAVHIDPWQPSSEIGVSITEEQHEGALRVKIVISHPDDERRPSS